MRIDETGGNTAAFVVRFHGVRGSHPVSSADTVLFGGNTSCVEVEAGPHRVVFDCGTGLIPLGWKLGGRGAPVRIAMLVSHAHHDHTMGFPFFRPVYDRQATLWLAGPARNGRSFQEIFEAAFTDPFFPVEPRDMGSRRVFETLEHGDVYSWNDPEGLPERGEAARADDLTIRVFRNLRHPNGGVLNFRLERAGKALVMATDVEGTEGQEGDLVDFARGADLLMHDAQYTDEEYEKFTQGWGHSTWRMAADVAWRAQVGRLVLYHHDPSHDDAAVEAMERQARAKFPRCISACEGLEIRI